MAAAIAEYRQQQQEQFDFTIDGAIMDYIHSTQPTAVACAAAAAPRSASVNDIRSEQPARAVAAQRRRQSTTPTAAASAGSQLRRRERRQQRRSAVEKGVARAAMDSLLSDIGAATSGSLELPDPTYARPAGADTWASGFRWRAQLPVQSAARLPQPTEGSVVEDAIEKQLSAAGGAGAARTAGVGLPAVNDPWSSFLSHTEADRVEAEAQHDLARLKARLQLVHATPCSHSQPCGSDLARACAPGAPAVVMKLFFWPPQGQTTRMQIEADNEAVAARAEFFRVQSQELAAERRAERLQATKNSIQQAAVSGLIGRCETLMQEMQAKAVREEEEYERRLSEMGLQPTVLDSECEGEAALPGLQRWSEAQTDRARVELARRRMHHQAEVETEHIRRLKDDYERKMTEAERRALQEVARLKARERDKRMALNTKLEAAGAARKAAALANRQARKRLLQETEAEADRKLAAAGQAMASKVEAKVAYHRGRAADAKARAADLATRQAIKNELAGRRAREKLEAGGGRAEDRRVKDVQREARRGQYEQSKRDKALAARASAAKREEAEAAKKAEASAYTWELKMQERKAKQAAESSGLSERAAERRAEVQKRSRNGVLKRPGG